jgi:ferritin heavy chain
MTSRCRQNFAESVESALNAQINLEFSASYAYQAMAVYFSHDSVSLPGLAKRFAHEADEERSHALKFVEYMTKRGGKVVFSSIAAPEMDIKSAKNAIEESIKMEMGVNASLLRLHAMSGEAGDAHLSDFIESEFLDDQVDSLKELADMLTQLERCGSEGLGLYLFDQKLSS